MEAKIDKCDWLIYIYVYLIICKCVCVWESCREFSEEEEEGACEWFLMSLWSCWANKLRG